MTQKHTPGPWEVKDGSVYSNGLIVALVYSEDGEKHRWYWQCGESNAARIVDCVNALDGYNPDKVLALIRLLRPYLTLNTDSRHALLPGEIRNALADLEAK